MDFADRVETVLAAIAGVKNLDTVGCDGRFFYSHLHDQLRDAKDYVERLAAGPAPLASLAS